MKIIDPQYKWKPSNRLQITIQHSNHAQIISPSMDEICLTTWYVMLHHFFYKCIECLSFVRCKNDFANAGALVCVCERVFGVGAQIGVGIQWCYWKLISPAWVRPIYLSSSWSFVCLQMYGNSSTNRRSDIGKGGNSAKHGQKKNQA